MSGQAGRLTRPHHPRGGWRIEHERGPASALHLRSADLAGSSPARGLGHEDQPGAVAESRTTHSVGTSPARLVRVLEAEGPALVLGSGQPETDVDRNGAASQGVAVARRRSGGGAVLVGPGQVIWVDLLIPSDDPLWDDDVARAAWWVGDAWSAALGAVGLGPAEVWKRPMKKNRWSALVCFAGTGPGEVLIGGRKVVGVAQRRTKAAALFQTAALIQWDPAAILRVLRMNDSGDSGKATVLAELGPVAAGVGIERAGPLLAAFIDTLMT
jgi:lipoate---protein ligase